MGSFSNAIRLTVDGSRYGSGESVRLRPFSSELIICRTCLFARRSGAITGDNDNEGSRPKAKPDGLDDKWDITETRS
jgi:hypothetical protein